jgi:hypothetical protein
MSKERRKKPSKRVMILDLYIDKDIGTPVSTKYFHYWRGNEVF